MQILLDTANLEELRLAFRSFPYDGITTNPSILSKEMANPITHLLKIKEIIGNTMLHCQTLSTKSDDIVKEAKTMINEIKYDKLYIKIPATHDGINAMYKLSQEGINVTGTAIYSVMQAVMCAKAGAKYIAPYVNRLDNMGYNGVELVKKMQDCLDIHNFETKIVGASFKNVNQVQELCIYGITAVTLPYDIANKLAYNDLTLKAIDDFNKDFKKLGKSNMVQFCET